MDNGKTNSAAYLLKPHGNFPLSIINYQFSKFHNLFLTPVSYTHLDVYKRQRVSYLQKPTYEDYVATDAEARRIAEELI